MTGYVRKKDNRRGIRFNLLVTGNQGTGKTTFINSLLDQNILPHRYQYNNKGNNINNISNNNKTIPKTITYSNISALNAIDLNNSFDPTNSHLEPGIAITETSVEIIDDDNTKILLTIIDTPGFGDNFNNNICIEEICNFLEQQFDLVLAEETKVKRNPRFEDTRIHCCLYFIEPTGHGLKELDIQSMIKFSKFVNILPIISRADSFTIDELKKFKKNILLDIEKFKIPIFQFQTDDDETDIDLIEESKYLSNLQPFAIITSDLEGIINDKKTRIRKYPWGIIDINDTNVSDFPILKSVLLGSQLQELKDITHDFLYENYRTEKLSSVVDLKNNFTDSTSNEFSSQIPSMSNLAEIAKSQSMAKFDLQAKRSNIDELSESLVKSTIDESNIIKEEEEEDEEEEEEVDDNEEKPIEEQVEESDIGNITNTPQSVHRESLHSEVSNASQSTLIKPSIINRSVTNSPQLSISSNNTNNGSFIGNFQVPQSQIDAKKLRKISDTVPYMLRHETIRSKHAKLEELERQSAIELAKKAEELERKARELKLRESILRERLEQSKAKSLTSNSVVSVQSDVQSGIQSVTQSESLDNDNNDVETETSSNKFIDSTDDN